MYHSRYWFKRRVRQACRRSEHAGESQRQTIYTLFLAFVPFAAIVVALAIASNAQLVQALALVARQADAALDKIRDVAGAAEDADPETLVRQAIWAFKNKERIEIQFVQNAPREKLCWLVGGNLGSVAFAAEDGYSEVQTEFLASMTRAQREEAVKASVLSWAAGQLEGLTVEDFSSKARDAAAAVAADVNEKEEPIVYAAFLKEALQQNRLTQADVELRVADPADVQDIAVSATGKQKVTGWIAARKKGFRDVPATDSAIATAQIEAFCSTQPALLWAEFQELRPTISATRVPAPHAPAEFAPEKAAEPEGTLARMRDQIVAAVLKPGQRGPLTELEAQRRARAIFDEARGNLEQALLAALPAGVDPTTETAAGGLVRRDAQAARAAIEQYLLAGCCQGLDEKIRTAGLTKEGLSAFPKVLQEIDRRATQEQARIEQLVSADVKRGIDDLNRSEQQLDAIIGELSATVLPEVANALASNQPLDPASLPALGDLATRAEKKLPKEGVYPLLDNERAVLIKGLLEHLKRRAAEYEKKIVDGVGNVAAGELESLRGLIDLRKFRDSSLVQSVQEEIEKMRPGVTGLKAGKQNARKRAEGLVTEAKTDLQRKLENRVRARLKEQLSAVTEAPDDSETRKTMAHEQFAKAFPVDADDVRGDQDDLESGLKEEWLNNVHRYLNQVAVGNAMRTLQPDRDFDPFAADAAADAQRWLVQAVAARTGIPQDKVLELCQAQLSETISGLLGKAQADRQRLQQEAVAGLSEADLPAGMAGTASDVAKAAAALQQRLIEKLGQLGPQAKDQLAVKAHSLVAARGQQTRDAQLAEIEKLTVQDLPEVAVRRIVEDKPAEAATEATRLLAPLIRDRTHADALIAPAGTVVTKKAETLVAERRKAVLDAQLAAVSTFSAATDKDLPAQLIRAIVSSQGSEEGGLGVARAALVRQVDERTRAPEVLGDVRLGAADPVAVLAEVLPALDRKGRDLVKEIHAHEFATQREAVAGQKEKYIIQPLSGQSLDDLLSVTVDAIFALAKIEPDRQLPATRDFLRKEMEAKAGAAHAKLAEVEKRVKTLIGELAGQPDVARIVAETDPTATPAGGATDGSGFIEGWTEDKLNALFTRLRPVADKFKVMDRVQSLVNEITWQPEWFRDSFFLDAGSEAQDIVKSLEQEGIKSADAYRDEIESKLRQRHKEILDWCSAQAEMLLDGRVQQLVDERLAAYRAGTKDFAEWFPNGYSVDEKKLATEAEDIVNRLTEARQD